MHTHVHGASTEASRHKCLIYDGHPSEQLPVVVPLLMDGLTTNYRCLYLGNPEMVQMVDTALIARGVDTAHETRRGALLFSSDRSHLASGTFEPRAMVNGLRTMIDGAVSDGFEGLCATGDMKWELGADENFDRLIEYEALLEQVFREKPLRGICQYHRDVLPARAIRDALLTHRSTYFGETFSHDNLFYVPPEILLETDEAGRSRQGDWMCQQIIRILDAEESRDKAATALAQVNQDLEKRVQERTRELEAHNRHLEAFSAAVSHDLRAPLRAISGYSEILLEEFANRLGTEGLHHVERLVANVRKMDDLVEGLLVLSQVVKADLNCMPLSISAIARDVSRELHEAEPGRSGEFIVHNGLRAEGDPVLVRVVMTNLLSNAWKFASKRANARIEVGARGESNGQRVFFVKDNGAGFDMARSEKLFGDFQRLDNSHDFPGTGVGLATVRRIIERHGGRIWAESRPDAGATFLFSLPAVSPVS